MFFTGDLDGQNLEELSLILSLSLQISKIFSEIPKIFSEIPKMQGQSRLWGL